MDAAAAAEEADADVEAAGKELGVAWASDVPSDGELHDERSVELRFAELDLGMDLSNEAIQRDAAPSDAAESIEGVEARPPRSLQQLIDNSCRVGVPGYLPRIVLGRVQHDRRL